MVKNIFIICTEHQLIQYHEAKRYFNINDEEIVLLFFKASKDDSWVERFVQSSSKIEIHIFINWIAKDIILNRQKIKDFIKTLRRFSLFKFDYIMFTSQYFDDCSNLTYSILNPKKYYLLDEGTASFGVVPKRGRSYIFNVILLIKSFLYWHYMSYPKTVVFFTQYPLNVPPFDLVEKYSLDFIDTSERNFTENQAIFLGSSFVEVKMMKEEVYLNLLRKVKEDLGPKHICYYAHRKEKHKKLQTIKNMGFEIKLNQKPFELVFQELKNCPSIISSFHSPILDTLSKKHIHIPEFIIYDFHSSLLCRDRKIAKEIISAYSKNSRLKIRKINL